LAVLLPLIFYAGDWIISRLRNRKPQVRLGGLMLASILVTATHPFLDWTNNYGMRFLLPWNPRWWYGDFAFVIDPFIWLTLGSAAFLLTAKTRAKRNLWSVVGLLTTYLVLIASSAQAREGNLLPLRIIWVLVIVGLVIVYRQRTQLRVPRRIAILALTIIIVYLTSLAGLHAFALRRARVRGEEISRSYSEQPKEVVAMAVLASPANWSCVMETDQATYKFSLSLWQQETNANVARFAKPSGVVATAVAEAERDPRAQVLTEFMRFPSYNVVALDCATQTLVQFADLRYTEPGKRNGSFSLEVPIECPTKPQ
jgi:inner membrane protein